MRGLNPNKAHRCDGITIHMIQICDNTLVTHLSIIYTNCIKKGVLPKLWKMTNVVPVYKKDSPRVIDICANQIASFLEKLNSIQLTNEIYQLKITCPTMSTHLHFQG